MPRIEDHLLVGLIRQDGGQNAARRVVAQDCADPHRNSKLELLSVRRKLTEERFILPHRLAFVVVDGPAAGYPTQTDNGTVRSYGAGLGLHLLLDNAGKSVAVFKAYLQQACATI